MALTYQGDGQLPRADLLSCINMSIRSMGNPSPINALSGQTRDVLFFNGNESDRVLFVLTVRKYAFFFLLGIAVIVLLTTWQYCLLWTVSWLGIFCAAMVYVRERQKSHQFREFYRSG